METMDYLNYLVETIHSATVATLGDDGHPQTRIIDMMLCDRQGVYFLTARGKDFYKQLTKQKYVAVSATKDKVAVSLRGEIRSIGSEKLDEIFDKNTYMKEIYPGNTRSALEVFCICRAQGEFFDLREPSHIVRDTFLIGDQEKTVSGYFVTSACTGCKLCYPVCPQNCIDIDAIPVSIQQNHCLHCGRCLEVCPEKAIEKKELNL